jgi:SAM-dependent methyltransferase
MTALKVAGAAGLAGGLVAATLLYDALGAFLPWRETAEARQLIELASIQPGQTVAEIGAGGGRFTLAIARQVGHRGRVYSTELSAEHRAGIAARARAAGLGHVEVVAGAALQTNLPDGCCDVVLMRNVYHHLPDPDRFAASLRKALRAGGQLVVIDFEPGALWLHGGRPADASERRPGHGVSMAAAAAELGAAGFTVRRQVPRWSGPMWLLLLAADSRGSAGTIDPAAPRASGRSPAPRRSSARPS